MPRYALFFVAFILMFLTGCGDAVSVAEPTEVVAVVGGETAVSPSLSANHFPHQHPRAIGHFYAHAHPD